MALSIGPPVVIPFMLFGGFFLNNEYVIGSTIRGFRVVAGPWFGSGADP